VEVVFSSQMPCFRCFVSAGMRECREERTETQLKRERILLDRGVFTNR
jgi:hypothetical protein